MTLLGPPPAPVAPTHRGSRRIAATAVLTLASVLLGFAAYLALLSQLHFDRAQHTAYANFRTELAQATAPTGPTVPGDPRTLLPLGSPVAVLAIPAIGLRDVVFEGTTGEVLQDGPGHLRDTVLPGQGGLSEILGRATTFGGPFGRLDELNPGQVITVTTGQGASRFLIIDIRRAGDPQPAPVAAGAGRLVLATADGSSFLPTGVLRVDADLISATLSTSPPAFTEPDLPASEQLLAGNPTAWLPLVLWGQALVGSACLIAWAAARWGRWQVWIVAVPVLGYLGVEVAAQASNLLLNLM
ncbi:MAG TPA: sortase [Pseudonocardiaceae bacterium]|nr:sortase [Pseudonocardiaceae bacterium]